MKQVQNVGGSGSFINQMMGNNETQPIVGKGCTQLHHSDRSCWEVIEVSRCGKKVILQLYAAKADTTKTNGQMGHQDWVLELTDRVIEVHYRNGKWRCKTETVVFLDGVYESSTPEQRDEWFGDNVHIPLIEGVTKLKVEWSPMSLIFGRLDYYYDWSF